MAKPSHMAYHESILRDAQAAPHPLPDLLIIGKGRRVDGIGNRLHPSLIPHFFSKHRFSRQLGAGQAHICLFPQISSQEAGQLPLKPRIHSGAPCMGNRQRHAGFLCDRQINGRRACHMSVHCPVAGMFPEKILPGPAVGRPVYNPEPGETVNMPSQTLDFLVKKTFFPGVDGKIKLYSVSVDVAVAVHYPAFRAAQAGSSQNLKHSHCFHSRFLRLS